VIKPFRHQLEEADMIRRRPACLIAADMGTGKSYATLLGLREQRCILIACPIAVGAAWVKQIEMFDADRTAVLLVDGTTASRAARLAKVAGDRPLAVIVNYDAVSRAGSALGKAVAARKWDAIVLDESHRVKSHTGKASKYFFSLAKANPGAKRICLSGTPTPHSPLDWWSQFRFLDPAILGENFTAFRNRVAIMHPWVKGWVTGFRPDALAAMATRIDPLIYRVRADDVLDLPDQIHTQVPVTLPPKSLAFYRAIEDEMIAIVETGEVVSAQNALVVVTRLQQATSGFAVSEQGDVVPVCETNAKAAAVRDLIEDLDEPVVVFAKFVHDLDCIAAACKSCNRKSLELSGRKKELAEWQSATGNEVIVVQQQAGGCGIDLTRSSAGIYFSLSHSLGDYSQSLARLRRPGQTRTVRYWHLVASETVDEAIYAAIERKADITEAVISRLTRRVTGNARRHK
jgi:SNF2 family DNA or RNA helicase